MKFILSCPDISEKWLASMRELDQFAIDGLLHPDHWLAGFYRERGIDYCRNHELAPHAA